MPTRSRILATGTLTGATPFLFVYGTLKPNVCVRLGRDERARLSRESENLGAATTASALYDLGGFPGLVVTASEDAAGRVHGVLLRLVHPARTLRWLDRYEGVAAGLYRRAVVPIECHVGGRRSGIAAVAYVLIGTPGPKRPIPGGLWPISTPAMPRNKM